MVSTSFLQGQHSLQKNKFLTKMYVFSNELHERCVKVFLVVFSVLVKKLILMKIDNSYTIRLKSGLLQIG